jgi:hypothetical protein
VLHAVAQRIAVIDASVLAEFLAVVCRHHDQRTL